jgi:hypothetical protein
VIGWWSLCHWSSLRSDGSRLVTGLQPQSLRSLRSLRLVRPSAGGARYPLATEAK